MSFEQTSANIGAFLRALKDSSVTEDDFGNKKIRSEWPVQFIVIHTLTPFSQPLFPEKVFDAIYVKSTFGPSFQLKASQFKIEK